jgi:hypothetical protein
MAALVCVGAVSAVALAADDQAKPPEAPPVSKFAAVAPLLVQLQYHRDQVAGSLESPRYTAALQSRVEKDANSLVILLMALGMHDQDSAVKASAPRLTELAEELAASSKDQAKAKAAYDAMVQAMANGATGGKPLAWEKRFVLGSLMKQVSTVNTRLKLYTRDESRFARSRETLGGFAALLAVVGQAAHADTHEVKDPAKIGDWYKYASEMRDAAGAVGEAIANNDFAAVQSSMQRLQTNCEACHDQFRPDLATTTTEE